MLLGFLRFVKHKYILLVARFYVDIYSFLLRRLYPFANETRFVLDH
jgi:hypothetical protein